MDTKLTLKLDQVVIEKAKTYAAKRKLSLSLLVENYLSSLTKNSSSESKIEISPFVKSLSTKANIPANLDYKKEYNKLLVEKHK